MAGPPCSVTLSTFTQLLQGPTKSSFHFSSRMLESESIAKMPEPTPPSPPSPKSHYSKHIIVGLNYLEGLTGSLGR